MPAGRPGSVRYWLGGRFYRMAFEEWGDPSAPTVVCVHGLTRNGRDFDRLAAGLADRFRVICPDLPGRGGSDWLDDPMLYQAQHYVAALSHLLAWVGGNVAWVGTSLGGICGMVVAAAEGNPITRLVLNDVGPFIPADALRRIRDYMVASGDLPMMQRFPDLEAIERHLRLVHMPFGPLSDADWAEMARNSARMLPDGRFTMHYDRRIAEPLRGHEPVDVDMWTFWDRIRVAAPRAPRRHLRHPAAGDGGADGGERRHRLRGAWDRSCAGPARSGADRRDPRLPDRLIRMKPLPRQAVHLPFQAGPYRMSMDLTTAPESEWFEFDERYPDEMAERRRLLTQQRSDVFGAVAGSEAARAEALVSSWPH